MGSGAGPANPAGCGHRGIVYVTDTIVEVDGQLHAEPTKSEAGRRTITLPRFVMDALGEHVKAWPPGESGFICHGRSGQSVRRSTFYRTWRPVTERAGLPGFKVRTLRHTGGISGRGQWRRP